MSIGEFKKRIEQLKNTHAFASEVAPHTFPTVLSEHMNKALDDAYTIIDEAKKEFPKIVESMHCVESVDNKLRFVNFVLIWYDKWFASKEAEP